MESPEGLSPRGRGKPAMIPSGFAPVRSIPAWAGETYPLYGVPGEQKVYPRVGGGNG